MKRVLLVLALAFSALLTSAPADASAWRTVHQLRCGTAVTTMTPAASYTTARCLVQERTCRVKKRVDRPPLVRCTRWH